MSKIQAAVTLPRGERVVQLRIGDKNMTINGVVVPIVALYEEINALLTELARMHSAASDARAVTVWLEG